MKKYCTIFAFLMCCATSSAQFDISAYTNYLSTHKNMSTQDLLLEYPAGNFLETAITDFSKAQYSDSIKSKYKLTDYEISLINKHGFMVSERLKNGTFIQALWDIYQKDLPVYISSDAILHALHYSFDNMLLRMESKHIQPKLDSSLRRMKMEVEKLKITDAQEPYAKALNDLDIYLTVTQKLLLDSSNCTFPENEAETNKLISLVYAYEPAEYPLFSETNRRIDFSQFIPRGHYGVRNENFHDYKMITRYFEAMMWLGRTEIQLTNPKNEQSYSHSEEDLQRMAILSALISETALKSGAITELTNIDGILSGLLGSQDNIKLAEINTILKEMSITAYDLCDVPTWKEFIGKVMALSSSKQLYSSQILYSDPFSPDQVVPPSVFLLMGQRPILDGFITANVVFDRVMYNDAKVRRMVPSTSDILFSLGNDASIQLLEAELNKYNYSSNLAGLRYLINSYDEDYWKSSVYTTWLNSIRSLNPPKDRANLPGFMKTAAWWQKTMTTQLASWAELRHDFLLYAKQPYTSSDLCSFPSAYIEPTPKFYENIKTYFTKIKEIINSDYYNDTLPNSVLNTFFSHWIDISGKLKTISEKILNNQVFSSDDNNFFSSAVREGDVCAGSQARIENFGWYLRLYFELTPESFNEYKGNSEIPEADKFIVADVHTIPTDEAGNDVGWVLHAGTGKINMAVITAPTPAGGFRSYVGPVYSYYEFISNDFKRLTNQEWRAMDGAPAYRPAFTNLYLADKTGNSPVGEKVSLFLDPTSVSDEKVEYNTNLKCSPNPFSNSTVISFIINNDMADQLAELKIFDLEGKLIKTLINQPLVGNNYSMIWDGTDNNKRNVPNGTYIYSLKIGNNLNTGKVNLVK
ncbi:MAG: DUF3160 domain-containing protein [bacterium]